MAVGDRGFHIADAFVEIHADKDPIKREIEQLGTDLGPAADSSGKQTGKRLGKGIGDGADGKGAGKRIGDDVDSTLGPRATKSGNDSGGKLSKGLSLAIVRNSPLIAAGISAALAFGAPAALAGATLLFGGIAIVAAAQSTKVQNAWQQTWGGITDTLKAESGPMATELEHLAGVTNSAFRGMADDIGASMNYAVPLVDRLANSVLNAAKNALPGLTSAMDHAGPAVNGLGNLIEQLGTGLGDFFDRIGQHSPAAGVAFTELGHVIGTLLPLLGELLGQGSELAAIVLPPLARILDVVAAALEHIAPILPVVAAGFTAWKIINLLTGPLGTLSAKLQTLAADGGVVQTKLAGAAAGGVARLSSALPILAVAVALVGTAWSASNKAADEWANALLQGGAAADSAKAKMLELSNAANMGVSEGLSSWKNFTDSAKGTWNDLVAQFQGYNNAQDKVSQKYREMLAAMDPVTRAQTLEKQALNDLNDALEKHGEGSASAESAERKYADASQHTKDVEEKTELAIHGVTQAMLDQADQARAGIDSLFGMQHAQEQQRQSEADLAQAIRDHGAASVEAHDSMNHYAEAIYNTAQATAQYKADQSGLKKDSEEYKSFLDSQLLVSLQSISSTLTGPTKDAVDRFIKQLQDAGVTTDGVNGKLDTLGGKNPQPTVGPVKDQITPQVDALGNELFDLGNAHPVPQADLDIDPAHRNKDVMVGMLNALGIMHPVPVADLETHPFFGSLQNALMGVYNLQGQKPTPTSFLNTGPLQTSTSFALGQLYGLGNTNPTPTVNLRDNATGPLSSISAYLRSLDGRVVTTYVNTIGRNVMGSGGILSPSGGGMIHAFAGGGFERMRANFASIVPPNSMRLIGDRSDVDEAFVPIDRSSRSMSILAETARRMGRDLVQAGGGGGAPLNPITGTGDTNSGGHSISIGELHLHLDGTFDFTKTDSASLRTLAQKIRAAIIELERERS